MCIFEKKYYYIGGAEVSPVAAHLQGHWFESLHRFYVGPLNEFACSPCACVGEKTLLDNKQTGSQWEARKKMLYFLRGWVICSTQTLGVCEEESTFTSLFIEIMNKRCVLQYVFVPFLVLEIGIQLTAHNVLLVKAMVISLSKACIMYIYCTRNLLDFM